MILIDWLINTIIVYKIQVILSTWSSALKTVEIIVDFRRNPPALPPLTCSGVIQIPGQHHLSGTEVGHSHRLHSEKGPAEVVLLSPGEEVQPATRDDEKVLLCHHWICPQHVNNNCLVQLSYQIWPQETTEGSPDYWANRWYNPPYSPRNVLIQSEQKGCQNHSGPLTSSTLPLWSVTVWSTATLQSSEHPKARHRNSFFPQAVHLMNTWTLNNKHETLNIIIHLFI